MVLLRCCCRAGEQVFSNNMCSFYSTALTSGHEGNACVCVCARARAPVVKDRYSLVDISTKSSSSDSL
jgi:hypothetical protein